MSEDIFIREVNEELRQDQLKTLWKRFGPVIIGAAALIVLATAGFVAYEYWSTKRANNAGDAFAHALNLARDGKADEALTELTAMEQSTVGAYPQLAQLRAGGVLLNEGKPAEAVAAFDVVANDSNANSALRNMARLRAGLVLVDSGSYTDVAARVEQLTTDTNPMRHSAREILAMAAWKEGKREDAARLYEMIVGDVESPQGVRMRAEMMLEMISAGSGQ